MFQRIKGAIDRTIAEEQARQKALADPKAAGSTTPSLSRSASGTGASSGARRPRPKKASQDVSKDASTAEPLVNPDPAVFEAAFVIDDEDMSRATTPKPSTGETDASAAKENGNGQEAAAPESNGDQPPDGALDKHNEKVEGSDQHAMPATAPSKATPPELPAEVRSKLRKLEKLEATYPELLRSYRIAHSRATSIEPFERALRENTPLTSIKDPDALVEYLNQLNLKGDMVMDEFKRVSAEKDSFKQKYENADKEIAALKEMVESLRAGKSEEAVAQDKASSEAAPEEEKGDDPATQHSRSPSATKSPVAQVLGIFSPKQKPQIPADSTADKENDEDFFSYDNEIPQLQAELEAKSSEIEKLRAEITSLRDELSTAKENSSGLVESLESATRELSESRDTVAVSASLQTQLDARNSEIASLKDRLEKAQSQLKELESQVEQQKASSASAIKEHQDEIATFTAKSTELEVEAKKAAEAKSILDKRVADLSSQIDSLKESKLEGEQKLQELTKKLESPTSAPDTLDVPTSQPAASSASSKKNKKKKKKGGAGTAGATPATEATAGDVSDQPPPSPVGTADAEALRAEIAELKEDVQQKDAQIERLTKQRKTEDDLREEIETLQENLLTIGQDHVEAKEKIKALEGEKATLKERITELEKELETSSATSQSNSKLQSEFESLKRDYEEIRAKSSTLQSDLGAAQQLAQSRYKDLTDLREVLQKAQPELKSLRQESATLKTTKEELTSKTAELRALEKREKELKTEITRAQRLAADREAEIKNLREKLTTETNTRLRLEDAQRVSGRDLRRTEAEKIELSAKEEKASRELQRLQDEMAKVQPRIKELEEETTRMRKEQEVLREEAELKTSQYANAQNLLGSMRDQTAELSIQLKESQGQAESLDEELAECRKLLGERTREAETMRRLLADVDERADSKVREMRARLDAAIEERDRLEDESSALARRKARETEELKQKIRDVERELKTISNEKDDLEHREREWKRRREELEAVEQKADAEVNEMRSTVSNLRSTLDASEQQVRDAEKAKSDLRRMLDDYRIRYDKLSKEAKSLQSKLSNTVSSSGRSSMDSNRSGALNGSGAPTQQGTPDVMYLKTILLQFLEQKDNKLRAQLVPVLGKLLRFDKADEQKWLAAVQHISAR
ncbi:putative viral a-type inclusion protein repeat protein [Phaeoacremonium minimum UCRPA7]|uniref:Putative viral a-type inclusion protein repeat protein n=1 Tax=Phaeoacremonium minimum (strain UCR-PA7) TaxID=1286976 RepID=R8BG04_PHAM7|nr:putative viral a-type inclusion protein repeat protein [Phaeoacremonium minimum UCRPA7]EON98228.1 putative viral a-type inclusion protein repeat protein [Phaeoacremonium minimum UCRPA7]